jgi:diguanylate cyclase (GGDEF)-like protein
MPLDHLARTGRLVDVLVDFAALMATDPPVGAVLQFLVDSATEVLPADAARAAVLHLETAVEVVAASGVWDVHRDRLHVVARRTADTTERVGLVRLAPVDEVDLLLPTRTSAADHDADPPNHFSVPLSYGETRLGRLEVCCSARVDSPAYSIAAAQKLADVAAAYLVNAHRRLELQRDSEASRQRALHDPLTGLPNRVLMVERLRHACERSRRSGLAAAVLYIDLDGFKAVNDTFGHTAGDQLLIAVALRLKGLLRPPDTLARLHGDEFVLMCEDLTDPSHAADIGRRLQSVLDEPVTVAGTDIVLRASVGVVVADAETMDVHQILADADRAMYEAKRRGGDQIWLDDQQWG